MDAYEVSRLRAALDLYVADVFASVPRKDQRAKGGCYLRGLMLEGRRKSIQPMADRLPDGNMQALQQFVSQSPWDWTPVRRRIAERVCTVIRPEVWVVDDVSFPKCGRESVGVARQYCGALGKRANCQVAVSVHAATDGASCPLEWELFLPQEWALDPPRRRRAGVPDDVGHEPKTRLALKALDRLAGQGLQVPVLVADAGYGRSVSFRLALRDRGWSYVLAVEAKEIARPSAAEPHRPDYGGLGPPTLPRYRTRPQPLSGLSRTARFTEVTWRQGSKGAMTSRFTVLRVRPSGKEARRRAQARAGGRERWDGVLPLETLLVEQPDPAAEPTGYWMSNLPATTPIADLVRWAKLRWRIEHDYRELKHGLGLDHFEGRTWRGWHHHVTLVTAAQAFLTLRRYDPKALSTA
ncbi:MULTISPECIES: IS701 family transposase [unclassified Streptomyces]|uniref:IS701 family transposase n=1 Tax=Streptomyces TaxID=1883 RepID=UPI00136E0E84|nr:IS701 family transposase [Streptomyces sp. SID335]MYZ14027.1 IS701 family transposase [Streptomyces sp. SID337]NDZ90627.1 IS701 family transposase [Streptomyces sp. SID10115]NDZ99623.1 IS701 family transposase [Streptomyces sp. SID10116]NEB48962.1 IS701 family transposase [Streptomyces sp. SID339]